MYKAMINKWIFWMLFSLASSVCADIPKSEGEQGVSYPSNNKSNLNDGNSLDSLVEHVGVASAHSNDKDVARNISSGGGNSTSLDLLSTTSLAVGELSNKYGSLEKEVSDQGIRLETAVERSRDVSDKANSILTVAVALGSIAALFTIFSAGVAVVDWKRKSKEHEEITKSFNELLEEFNKQYESSIKSMRSKVDQFNRVSRLFIAITSSNYDSELFYSELSQLKRIDGIDGNFEYLLEWLEVNRDRFEPDVRKLIDELHEIYSG